MNYDLCDLLNRKLEAQNSYIDLNSLNKSVFKSSKFLDEIFEKMQPELYLETLEDLSTSHVSYGFWVYRNGKISNQLFDFEQSARKVINELANLSYSKNPALDAMYFSGVMKFVFAQNKAMYLECCIRPSLDQMIALKDLERIVLPQNGQVIWRINDRRGKNVFYEGIGLDSLHGFKWSKIK